MHRFCGMCGTQLNPDNRCPRCGWMLPSGPAAGSRSLINRSADDPVMYRFCGMCGNPLGNDSRCARCGWSADSLNAPDSSAPGAEPPNKKGHSDIPSQNKKPTKKKKTKKKSKILFVIIPAAVLVAALAAVVVLNALGIINLFKKPNNSEIVYRPSPEEYLKDIGKITDKESAKKVDLLTEAEACREFSKRGFKDAPINTYYNTKGDDIGIYEISDDSKDTHPYYETYYRTDSGDLWTVILMGDVFYARPVTYSAENCWDVPHILSEKDSYWIYDGKENSFYTVKLDKRALELKVVDRISANTLDDLDAEKVDEL